VGSMVGSEDMALVGIFEGVEEGVADCIFDGEPLEIELGELLRAADGIELGAPDGSADMALVGIFEGVEEGVADCNFDGFSDGFVVGMSVSLFDGVIVGLLLKKLVGDLVGTSEDKCQLICIRSCDEAMSFSIHSVLQVFSIKACTVHSFA